MDPGIGISELRKGENSKSLMLQYETSERQKKQISVKLEEDDYYIWTGTQGLTRMWANAQPDGRPAEHR